LFAAQLVPPFVLVQFEADLVLHFQAVPGHRFLAL
jgi:hypothetical protein